MALALSTFLKSAETEPLKSTQSQSFFQRMFLTTVCNDWKKIDHALFLIA